MLSFLSKRASVTARIDGIAIEVRPRETLLQAALRHGMDFPHSCRVGGCATCKCRLVEGRVKSLTQASYVLSDTELEQGFVLACQSVPTGDVTIALPARTAAAARGVAGRILAQRRLTHDITELRVQLDESLAFKGGQYAQLRLDALPGAARSYSFAAAAQPDAQVRFFVRRVPGGAFSTLVNDRPLLGQRMTVLGPLGDFWLRPGDGPVLMVAGGSGLAPLLALIEDAVAAGVSRPATLLFGARTQADLYALDRLDELAARWRGGLRVEPVLSDEPGRSAWTGARGRVTDALQAAVAADAQAYLCGPPGMVDSAVALLRRLGVPDSHIHADRFTTAQPPHSSPGSLPQDDSTETA